MWIAKLSWKHNCIIGNRCKTFDVTAIGIPLEMYEERGYYYYTHLQILSGKPQNIAAFISDLKKDKDVSEVEVNGNTVFFIVKKRYDDRVPTTHYNKKIFFLKPVAVDTGGYEFWEIASWKKEYLMEFIKKTKTDIPDLLDFKLQSITKSKVNDLYFPQLLPKLTPHQKRALDLAVHEGYYEFPRKVELADLAKRMHVALSTYREHLRIAEKKMMPMVAKQA